MNQTQLLADATIGFIGGGVMAEAILAGLLRQRAVNADQVIVSDVLAERGAQLQERYGVRTTTNNRDVVDVASVLILSIKPQVLDSVLAELHGHTDSIGLIISIIAGAPISRLAAGLGNDHIVRTMPNTPAQVGEGMTVWTAAPTVSADDRARAAAILGSFGLQIYVEGEPYLDMATAISGSGPAYVFLFMEALVDAAVQIGFPRRIAEQLVTQTVRGSVAYAVASDDHLAVLRNQVTSPGGTTAAALHQLESGGLRTTITRGVLASYERSIALGAGPAHPPSNAAPAERPAG